MYFLLRLFTFIAIGAIGLSNIGHVNYADARLATQHVSVILSSKPVVDYTSFKGEKIRVRFLWVTYFGPKWVNLTHLGPLYDILFSFLSMGVH